MDSESKHAIVFGAGGLLGWAVLNELLAAYPSTNPFSKVTAIVNRAISEKDLRLPHVSTNRPEFEIVSGVNLLNGTAEDLAKTLKEKASGVETITHAFYFVFNAHNDDQIKECQMNCDMMRRVSGALNIVAPSLKSLVYSGGTRGYGIYVPGGTFTPPLDEDLADQLPDDYAKTVAYPWFRKILTEASHGRDWTWTEVCPDAVIGFSPNGSGYSLALHWGQYLSLYAYNHANNQQSGTPTVNIEVPFPGSEAAAKSTFSPISGKMLGRISIYAAMNPKEFGKKVINMADADAPVTYGQLWPKLVAWFGLTGTGPVSDTTSLKPGEYITKHRQVFSEKELPKALTCGVGAGSTQLDSIGWWLTFDRELSLKRLRSLGFKEQRDPAEGWFEAFGKLREAGIII